MKQDIGEIRAYTGALSRHIREEYHIDEQNLPLDDLKRGLRNADGTGVSIGVTKVGSVQGYTIEDGKRVPQEGRLLYRGMSVSDIVEAHSSPRTFGFEEVAYLLLMGYLPAKNELDHFNAILAKARTLPKGFTERMIMPAPSRNVMNKLARSVLALYSFDDNPDDNSVENMMRQSVELIGSFPSIVANAYAVKRHYIDGDSLYLHIPQPELSVAENFLRMIRKNKFYTEEEAYLLDIMLMLHAEHGGGNNSTFVCRALSSTGTDTYSAIAAAVGALKGPLHGGANAKVMEMFRYVKENVGNIRDNGAIEDYLVKILDGEAGDKSGKIYGLGHAVYTCSDPRAMIIRRHARNMAELKGFGDDFELLEKIEKIGIPLIMERRKSDMPMCANVDMYSGMVYKMLGIPEDVYTPLFASARIAGWCAHRIEEVLTGGRIMRPAYKSVFQAKNYVAMKSREPMIRFSGE